VLLEQQSLSELLRVAADSDNPKSIYMAISSPSRIAIASALNMKGTDVISYVQARLQTSGLPCTVIDMSFAEQISLELTKQEATASDSVVLTSHCPGWSLYAEKTQDESIVSRLSKFRSPDQIAGVCVKSRLPGLSTRLSRNPWLSRFARLLNPIFFVTVSPCFDKKLEILRPAYKLDEAMVVDLVLTTTELLTHLATSSPSPAPLMDLAGLLGLRLAVGAHREAGGYAEGVAEGEQWVTQRNRDLLFSKKAGKAYGFRNIQNIVRRLRTAGELSKKKIIEVMACPGACAYGGGQPKFVATPLAYLVHQADPTAVTSWWKKEASECSFEAAWRSLTTETSSIKW